PAPVVADQDPLNPAAVELDLEAGRAGVERVLDQLLDDRSGALDDLARGDAVDDFARQAMDFRHGRSLRRGKPAAQSARESIAVVETAVRRRSAAATPLMPSKRRRSLSTAPRGRPRGGRRPRGTESRR